MKISRNWIAITVFVLIVIASCDNSRVYESYVPVAKDGWSKDSVAVLTVPIENSEAAYNLYINIRNTNEYANSNLWLFLDMIAPNGQTRRDTLECIVADSKGKWFGSGWGGIYTLSLPYLMNVRLFSEKGDYQFKIQQGMRSENLKGIHDIGLRIETSQQ